jgi:hypothetical protein
MPIANIQVSIDGGPWLNLDQTTFPVVISGLAPNTTYGSLRFREVDSSSNDGDASVAIGPVTTDPTPPPLHYRIGCGVTFAEGSFEADTLHSYFTGGSASGPYGSSPDLTGLVDPAPGATYTRFRYNTAGNTFLYTFPVTALRDYKIRLHFGVHSAAPFGMASTPMTITINGVAHSFDPFIAAGSPSTAVGYIQEYSITQGAGTSLTINFAGDGSSQPYVMAIEVIEIPPMAISTAFLADAGQGTSYTATLATSDAVGSVTWALTSGSLPTGLSLNTSTGVISGTPTVLETSTFVIRATDSKTPTNQTASRIFTLLVDSPITDFILDDISATALRAYSTRKIRSAYSGNCWRIKRASDSTETDIGFNTNGVIDKAAIATFAAGTTYVITKWYDQSTTNDPLVPISTQEPTGDLNHFLGSRAGVAYGLTGTKSLVSVANISTTNPKVYMAAHVRQVADRDFEHLFACGTANRLAVIKGKLSMYGNGYHDNGRWDAGRSQITAWFTSGADKVVIDGIDHPCLATSVSATDCGNALTTGFPFYLGTYHAAAAGQNFAGVFGEAIVFEGTVSGPDDAAIQASQTAFFIGDGTPLDAQAFHYNVIMEGDSLTFGYGATTNPATLVQTAKGADWRIRNVANSGQQLITDMTPDAAIQVDPYWDSIYTKNILVIWAGINDFHNNVGMTAATLETALQSYVAARKAAAVAAGTTLKVVVTTITACDPANGYITSGQQTERTTFNTWLRANWNTFADALCDLDALPHLSDPTNATYYHNIGGGDFGLHFTDLAYTGDIGPAFVTAISSV